LQRTVVGGDVVVVCTVVGAGTSGGLGGLGGGGSGFGGVVIGVAIGVVVGVVVGAGSWRFAVGADRSTACVETTSCDAGVVRREWVTRPGLTDDDALPLATLVVVVGTDVDAGDGVDGVVPFGVNVTFKSAASVVTRPPGPYTTAR
jgi:hypothetical protein